MHCYLDNNYGSDADGNRGRSVWEYELEPSDDEHILDYLKILIDEYDPIVEAIPEIVEIPFINSITEDDVFLDVDTTDYLDTLRVYKIIDKDNFQHFASTIVKYDKKTALALALYLIEILAKTK